MTLQLSSLPDFTLWQQANQPGFGLLDYLSGVATCEMAVAFTALFWPDLVEYGDAVLLADGFTPALADQWRDQLGGDTAALERVMNHRHLSDLLPGSEEVGQENLRHLGQVLVHTWQCRLERQFPHRTFRTDFYEDPEAEEVTITFCQE
ncbi:MAG: hypothetical protein H7Z41_11325 [Cytophagales bacterium]|nr:hypothetical protein [Armatimonadota bacterium]